MNERDFIYWLNGFIELNGDKPTEEQWTMIKGHLSLVMTKVTPVYPGGPNTWEIPSWPYDRDGTPVPPHFQQPQIYC